MVKALSNVSLKIKSNEVLLVTGHSGSGKSTLLNMMGILDIPTKGKMKLMGKPVPTSESERAKLRSEFMGFVFQDFGLIPSITAHDNIVLPTLFGGNTPQGRAGELAEMLGITKRMHHYPRQLSGGEKQRVAIARSLINDPKILFADEPTGNLDSKTGKSVMNLLRDLADQGKAVVIVSHNPEHKEYADRVIKMKDGEII
ncbi:MAG: ABC transporter ATP-binding protein [Candidatus Altiarchaeota archaeon]|nr:ABC transporter ATP-binding protein [Candidatus Altiarchaeota archaeon]